MNGELAGVSQTPGETCFLRQSRRISELDIWRVKCLNASCTRCDGYSGPGVEQRCLAVLFGGPGLRRIRIHIAHDTHISSVVFRAECYPMDSRAGRADVECADNGRRSFDPW